MHLPYMRPCQNNNNCVTSKKLQKTEFSNNARKKIRGCFKSAGKAWKNRAFLE